MVSAQDPVSPVLARWGKGSGEGKEKVSFLNGFFRSEGKKVDLLICTYHPELNGFR